MEEFITHLLVTAVLLGAVAWLMPGIKIEGVGSALLGALALGIANAIVRPILILVSLYWCHSP